MRRNLVAGLICLSTIWLAGCTSKPAEEKDAAQVSPEEAVKEMDQLRDELIELVKNGDEAEKVLAAEALGKLGDEGKPAEETLKGALASPDPLLKVAAAQAILLIDKEDNATTQAAMDTLVAVVEAEEGAAQLEAARAIGNADGRASRAIEALGKALKDEERHVALHAAHALASIGEPAVPVLIEAVKDEKSRRIALLVIEDLGPTAKSAIPTLKELLSDKEPGIRRAAILALAGVGPDASEHVDVFIAALDDEDPLTRASAAFALSRMGDAAKGAKEPLEKVLNGDDKFVAILAAVALVDLELAEEAETDKIVETLTAGLRDEHPRVRVAAAESLGKLGAKAKAAAPALDEASKDKIERVSQAAKDAAAKVGG